MITQFEKKVNPQTLIENNSSASHLLPLAPPSLYLSARIQTKLNPTLLPPTIQAKKTILNQPYFNLNQNSA